MTLLTTETVALQIYDWAFIDAEPERREEYPFLSRVKGENAERYLRFFSQLDPEEASAVSRALVKRMNQARLLRKKSNLTTTEEKYVQAYLQFEEVRRPRGFRMIAASKEPAVVWTVEMRKALKALVKEHFSSDFGRPERLSSNEWVYEMDAGHICVQTWLDFGGRSSVRYGHTVFQGDCTPLEPHFSILQRLGAALMTRWKALQAEELMDAAETVCSLSKHFIFEMTKLFA